MKFTLCYHSYLIHMRVLMSSRFDLYISKLTHCIKLIHEIILPTFLIDIIATRGRQPSTHPFLDA